MSKLRRILLVLLAVTLCGVSAAHAAEPDPRILNRDWMALSTTAMGVTGDARLTADSITFNKRAVFKLRLLKAVVPEKMPSDWGATPGYLLYEIVDPKPQAVANGNHLCGHPKLTRNIPLPRYMAIGLNTANRNDDVLNIMIFSGKQPPENLSSGPDSCGDFSYFAYKSKP
jgi:hypothetical protein